VSPASFVDENDLALGKRLAERHDGVRFPGHPDLPEAPRGSLDDHWLPIVGRDRLVVITRDARIRYRPAERLAWVRYGVRGFVLTGKRSQSTSASLALLEAHWRRIESLVLAEPDGPWMRSITSSGIGTITLG
jgi:PIN like domain